MTRTILTLCGGIGGAKLVYGLSQIIPDANLINVVNTGDDFIHYGLNISPDLDTVTYTLAGINDKKKGWGVEKETWAFLNQLKVFEGEDWFQLGDRDLATHIIRTTLLQQGKSLSEVTNFLKSKLGVNNLIVPMSETPVRTLIQTNEGLLSFQEYFVKKKCEPQVLSIEFSGCEEAQLPPILEKLIESKGIEGVIICPSNPFLSIDPILSIKPLKDFLINRNFKVLAISPYIKNDAIKGPSAKIAYELNKEPSPVLIDKHYEEIADALVIDHEDKGLKEEIKMQTYVESIVMRNNKDKQHLAKFCIEYF